MERRYGDPRPEEPVEIVDLAFGAGFGHAVLEPTAQGKFDQLAGRVRMLGMDALCRLLAAADPPLYETVGSVSCAVI